MRRLYVCERQHQCGSRLPLTIGRLSLFLPFFVVHFVLLLLDPLRNYAKQRDFEQANNIFNAIYRLFISNLLFHHFRDVRFDSTIRQLTLHQLADCQPSLGPFREHLK